MDNCKDCYHYHVCDEQKIINHKISKSVCKHFIDKSLIIQLPCNVNDTLFVESAIKGRVISIKPPDVEWIIENTLEFGKSIFLTREEAEQALKERSNGNG